MVMKFFMNSSLSACEPSAISVMNTSTAVSRVFFQPTSKSLMTFTNAFAVSRPIMPAASWRCGPNTRSAVLSW
jgi:hypothetical protein